MPRANAAAKPPPRTVKKKVAVAPKKPRISPNGYQLPDPIPKGEILTDLFKKQWRIGSAIGLGGFGEIYLASNDVSSDVGMDAKYVVKVEHHTNGPLFSEMHFYHRAAKAELIENWKTQHKLKFLGMPRFVASGSHDFNGTKYRFLIMERFGQDLYKLFESSGKKFTLKTVFTVGIKIIDILEYIHSNGYIHADVKGSNLLLGYGEKALEKVYLVDFGLACKYVINDGNHKAYKEDPRKAHDGTIEYTSRDAHVGVHSRRSDLEILGYNLLQWLCGKLPWEDDLKDPDVVKQHKNRYMKDIPLLMKDCSIQTSSCKELQQYLEYVARVKFDEKPDYEHCKKLFKAGLKRAGVADDGKLEFGKAALATKGAKSKRVGAKRKPSEPEDDENEGDVKTEKVRRTTIREPCAPAQVNRKSSPRVKRKIYSSTNKDATPVKIASGDASVPTPAMLMVMQMKQQRELEKEVKPTVNPRKKSRSASPISPPKATPIKVTRGRDLRPRRTCSSTATSPADSEVGISPELF